MSSNNWAKHLFLFLVAILFLFTTSVGTKSAHSKTIENGFQSKDTYIKALKLYKLKRVDAALREIKKITEEERNTPLVNQLIGKIHYYRNDFDSALSKYKDARSDLDPSGDTNSYEIIQRLITETKKMSDLYLQEHHFDTFTILREPGIPTELISELNDQLETVHKNLGNDFRVSPNYSLNVIVYDRSTYEDVVENTNSTATYDRKIHLPYAPDSDTKTYDLKTLYHEYAHLLLKHSGLGKIPLWFNEGFAIFLEYRHLDTEYPYRYLKLDPLDGKVPKFEKIVEFYEKDDLPWKVRLYADDLVYSFVDFLHEKHNLETLIRLVKETPRVGSLRKAIKETLESEFSDIKRQWQEWVKEKLE